MSFTGPGDFGLEVAKGTVAGHFAENKFARAPFGCQTTPTDIWDRADTGGTQQLWIAPTAARTHQIVSTDVGDAGGGIGARTVRVVGLTSWSTVEVSEDITMNGTTNVPTVNAYVIIHRMKVLTKGATDVNIGTITATADADTTITAQINAEKGQTQMSMYGIPSTQIAYMGNYYASFNKASGASASVLVQLLFNPEPDAELTNFMVRHTQGLTDTGTSGLDLPFNPPAKFPGPGILKVQCEATSADRDLSAGFDLILVNN